MNKLALTLVVSIAMGGLLTGGSSVLAETVSETEVVILGQEPPEDLISIEEVSNFNFGTIRSSNESTRTKSLPDDNTRFPLAGGLLYLANTYQGKWIVSVREDAPLFPGASLEMAPRSTTAGTSGYDFAPKFTLNNNFQRVVSSSGQGNTAMLLVALETELITPANAPSGDYDSTVTFNVESAI